MTPLHQAATQTLPVPVPALVPALVPVPVPAARKNRFKVSNRSKN